VVKIGFDLLRASVSPWWVLILILVLILVYAPTMPKTLYPFSPTSKRAEC